MRVYKGLRHEIEQNCRGMDNQPPKSQMLSTQDMPLVSTVKRLMIKLCSSISNLLFRSFFYSKISIMSMLCLSEVDFITKTFMFISFTFISKVLNLQSLPVITPPSHTCHQSSQKSPCKVTTFERQKKGKPRMASPLSACLA